MILMSLLLGARAAMSDDLEIMPAELDADRSATDEIPLVENPLAIGLTDDISYNPEKEEGGINELIARDIEKLNKERKKKYLQSYARCGNLSKCARITGISLSMHYYWMNSDPQYKEAFAIARGIYDDSLEEILDDRVKHGTERDVWYRGEKVGKTRTHSENLLMFALKGAKPQKYRDKEIVGLDGSSIKAEELRSHYKDRKQLLTEIAAEMNRLMAQDVPSNEDAVDAKIVEPLLGGD